MKIDKINDEFIVDCTNNSKEERQEVYKFLVDNRNYGIQYLSKSYPIIVCNKQYGASNWDTLIQYYNGFNAKKDIPVYTFEQFKEMYLDNNNMKNNKQIIGYKLIKEEYREAAYKIANVSCFVNDMVDFQENSYIKEKLEEAGVLDLWFKKVYGEEQFKVDDFIALEYNTHNFCAKKGYIAKVIKEFNGKYISIKWITETDQIDGEYYPSDFRKATPEEIEEANKKIVKMYSSNKGEFEIEVVNGKAYYRPENKHLPKEWIRDIINSYGNILIQKNVINPYNVEISSINVGCYHNCKKEDWENVYKLLK